MNYTGDPSWTDGLRLVMWLSGEPVSYQQVEPGRNTYLARLDACFHLLAREPHRGRVCDDIRPGYRKYHVGRHLIFYRESPEGVEVIRILHDRMDIEAHLDE
jgi:toxin ParE1/3/4